MFTEMFYEIFKKLDVDHCLILYKNEKAKVQRNQETCLRSQGEVRISTRVFLLVICDHFTVLSSIATFFQNWNSFERKHFEDIQKKKKLGLIKYFALRKLVPSLYSSQWDESVSK